MTSDNNTLAVSLNIAVLTISDSRTDQDDHSGAILIDKLTSSGHQLVEKHIVADDIYQIRALISPWIADDRVDAIITNGGTGITGRDVTPDAIRPLLDREIEGFGETFRWLSFEKIGISTILSRAMCGIANGTLIFSLPGSTNACQQAWDDVVQKLLDSHHKPCNFAKLIPRLKE